MEKMVVRISIFQSSVAIVSTDRPIDLLHKPVDWFLYNGNTGVNGKVNVWLR